MSTYAIELARARISALRALFEALHAADSPAEQRRCAVAIFRAPKPEDLDDCLTYPSAPADPDTDAHPSPPADSPPEDAPPSEDAAPADAPEAAPADPSASAPNREAILAQIRRIRSLRAAVSLANATPAPPEPQLLEGG